MSSRSKIEQQTALCVRTGHIKPKHHQQRRQRLTNFVPTDSDTKKLNNETTTMKSYQFLHRRHRGQKSRTTNSMTCT